MQQIKSKATLLSKQQSIVEMELGSSINSMSGRQMSRVDDKQRKIGHRRINEDGMVTYKKKTTTELMSAIQLGIGQSITSMSAKQKRDLLLQDFSIVETVTFPKDGSQCTPSHEYSDFRFKTYAPVAFRYFRELFGIQPDDFLISMCNDPLKELSNPGASGSIFYISEDDEFIIKTVSNKEADFLQKLLPGYYMNLNQNPRTLLPKFYGLFCYQCGGKNIRFVVMNNLLPMSVTMHEKYDLKGSTYKRRANKQEREKKSPTLKDLDFASLHADGIMLEADTFNALLKTIERDCRVLQSFQIMDYSLLMSLHNLDHVIKQKESNKESPSNNNSNGDAPESKISRGKSMHQRLAHFSTTMEAIHAKSEPLEIDENQVPMGGIPARNQSGERLLLFIGLIDILQSYRLAKKFEHAVKSVVHDGDTISVHRPGFYAQRFQAFFNSTVFKKIPSLDQPQVKGAVRFKKLVQIVRVVTDPTVKHSSPTQKKLMERKALLAANGRPDILSSTNAPTSSTNVTQASNTKTGVSSSNAIVTATASFNSTTTNFNTSTSILATTTTTGELLQRVLSPSLTIASNSTPTHPSEGTPSSFTFSSPSCSITSTPGHSSYMQTDTHLHTDAPSHSETHSDMHDYIESDVDEGLGRLSREVTAVLSHLSSQIQKDPPSSPPTLNPSPTPQSPINQITTPPTTNQAPPSFTDTTPTQDAPAFSCADCTKM